MRKLSSAIGSFFQKGNFLNTMSKHIFYKIVDSYICEDDHFYRLQCINTFAIFDAKLADIVKDKDIVKGLHPIQSCYLGMELAKSNRNSTNSDDDHFNNADHYMYARYGRYQMIGLARGENIIIADKTNQRNFTMGSIDIVLDQLVIREFDSTQAFHIGYLAGVKLQANKKSNKQSMYPSLRIVK